VSYRDMSRRLAELEDADEKRRYKVYDRVLERLSTGDLDCFIAYLKRRVEQDDETLLSEDTSADEWRVLCLVEHLAFTDPEARPGDLIGIPIEMMREHGYEVPL
jgi:hypothetical protein